MGVTLVYPIGTASARHSDILRYSIRSLCKYNDVEQVVVIGAPVPWFTGLYIPATDKWMGDKARNVNAKLLTITADDRVGDSFWWMSDDIFQVAEWNGIPHNTGDLSRKTTTGYFDRLMKEAAVLLRSAGVKDAKSYFSHHPLPMEKKHLREMFERFGSGSYQSHIIYGNLYTNGNATLGPNAKVAKWNGPSFKGSFFSSSDVTEKDPAFYSWMKETFPEPSKFERKEDNA